MTDSRLHSGHQPLDEILGGGLPANGISIIMGLPGTGKTIIAQQYTFRNARPDRPAVYFSTLSEPLEKILRFGQTLDFFDTSAVGTSVFYENLGLVAGRDGLAGVGDHVAAVLKQRRPGLVVIDSFKALQALAEKETEFRQFLHQLAGRLTAFPAASLWVGEYDAGEVALSAEFAVADAIVELATVPAGQREQRFLSVRKLRGSGFRSGQHGYRLTPEGLHLFPRLADIPAVGSYPLGDRRIPYGIPGLDPMLGGGLWPGACTMVAGPSGSGKTVMGLHFIFGGARHGEPGVIATLQENPTQLQRMLGGLGWPIAHPAVEVMYRSPVDIYIDEWVYELLAAAERTKARRVLVDSLLDVRLAAVEETRFLEFMYSLAQRFSRQGISLLVTHEIPGFAAGQSLSGVAVSHLSDNVIMIDYHRERGMLKRSLAIVKTRASGHTADMCQFRIGPDGITLSGTATPGGEPATGHHHDTARPDSPRPPQLPNLFRSLLWTRRCVILGSLSRDGLARESAAVAPRGGVVLARERPAARPLLAGEDVAQERPALPEAALPSSSGQPRQEEGVMNDDVMIAVGPHKASSTAAVLGPVARTVIETARFAGTGEGYGRLAGFARRREHRRWAVEGCHGAGRSLAQRLVADGELVLDVPAELAAGVRVYCRGHGGKADKHDAVPGRPGCPRRRRCAARGLR